MRKSPVMPLDLASDFSNGEMFEGSDERLAWSREDLQALDAEEGLEDESNSTHASEEPTSKNDAMD